MFTHRVLSKLNEKLFALKRDLDDFRPGKRVDFDVILKDHKSRRRHAHLNLCVALVLEDFKMKSKNAKKNKKVKEVGIKATIIKKCVNCRNLKFYEHFSLGMTVDMSQTHKYPIRFISSGP